MLLIVVFAAAGCRPGTDRAPGGPPLRLSLAVSPVSNSALIAVAEEKGYFKDAGLEVSLALHPSGRDSLEAVCRGEAQVATVACVAFAAKALEDHTIRILASLGATWGSQVVARRDRNIRVPSDLRGKRIGYSSNTVSDYFLYAFLMAENIPPKEVTEVDLPPGRQADAVVGGEVDAVSAFEHNAFDAKRRMEGNAVSWNSQNNLAYQWLLVAREDVLRTPEPLKRLLKALIRAEEFTRDNEEEAKRIVVRKWGFDPAFLEESWQRTRLNVSMSQSVVTNLQNFTLWRMRGKERAGTPPDVLNYLHTGILDAVAPGSVSIFR